MKFASAVLLLLAFAISAAKADFILKWMVDTSGQRFEVAIKQTDTKLRADFSEFSVIQSSTTDNATMLIHASKVYIKLDKFLSQILTEINKSGGNSGTGSFARTGHTETINGYETEEFQANLEGIQITLFVTPNFPDAGEFEKTMRNWLTSPAVNAFHDVLAVAEKCSGFPIRMVTENLRPNYSLTFETLQKANLDDREFEVPNDYTEVSLPEMSLPEWFGR
jgi:hypothetical protein